MEHTPGRQPIDIPPPSLPDGSSYIIPKALNEQEAARRRSLPHGSTMAERQQQGIAIAATIMERLSGWEDSWSVVYSARYLAASGINTAWFCFDKDTAAMHARLEPPALDVHRLTSAQILPIAIEDLRTSVTLAGQVVDTVQNPSWWKPEKKIRSSKEALGAYLGSAAYLLACTEIGNDTSHPGYNNRQVREKVTRLCEQVDYNADHLVDDIGTRPSLAQLADIFSPLARHWLLHAPFSAREAYAWAMANP